jgi:hypothetical protein
MYLEPTVIQRQQKSSGEPMSAGTRRQVLILGDGFSRTLYGSRAGKGRSLATAMWLIEKILATKLITNHCSNNRLLRLPRLIAYLLKKNEQLRQTVAAQSEKGPTRWSLSLSCC